MSGLAAVERHVRALRRKGVGFEKMLPELTGTEQSPWNPWLYGVRWIALAAAAFAFWRDTPAVGIGLLAVAAVLLVVERRTTPRADRARDALVRDGIVTRGAIVQANSLWFRDDNREPQPGSVVVTFDADLAEDPPRLHALAERVGGLKEQDRTAMDEGTAAVAWSLYHEIAHTPRVPLPKALAGAPDTWLYSAMLPADASADGGRCVWVLAHPDEAHPAGIAVLPREVVGDAESGTGLATG